VPAGQGVGFQQAEDLELSRRGDRGRHPPAAIAVLAAERDLNHVPQASSAARPDQVDAGDATNARRR
jgi:hypothetical protein